MNRENLQKFQDKIDQSKNILIIGHERPDGDLISSALSLKLAFQQINKEAIIFFDDFAADKFSFLPKVEDILVKSENKEIEADYDLIIGLDYGSKDKLCFPTNFKKQAFFVTIDHHLEDSQIGDLKIINTDYSSTCEMLYVILKSMDVNINKDIANCLICGIITDTGGLQHQRVGVDTFLAVSHLLQKGARPYRVARNVFRSYSFNVLKLWGRILSRIKKDPNDLMSFSVVSRKDLEECACSIEDLAGLVSIINTNPDTKFTLLLTEEKENLMNGSLRSEGYKGVDVSKIAKIFGGGGHKLASGFRSDKNLQEILRKIYQSMSNSIDNA